LAAGGFPLSIMRIAVAVSGGSDSLLALGLLRAAGHDVAALHAHFLPPGDKALALAEAIDVQCRALGVPFAAVDLSREFRARVIDPFAAAYAAGRTPNPCAACNRDMKFGLLLDAALARGAEAIATGHFARVEQTPDGPTLYRGADDSRDQSYFLSLVSGQSLARTIFPLAGRRKAEHPAALAALGLIPPLPSESREICFVPGDDYRAFLVSEGFSLQGLWRHTIGQRRGLGIAYSEPLYVIDKDPAANALIVGVKAELAATLCRTGPANCLVSAADWPEAVLAQTCYRMKPRPATARLTADGGLDITFADPVARPTPGQVAVLYDAEGRVLAGGEIIAAPGLVIPENLG